MGEFRLKCPKNYPINCNLLDNEKESLERTEKLKGFLLYQFKDQDSYLVETVKKYFHTPTYYVFDAQKEVGLGVKICKICRLALASDFGIAVLTPFNHNVFLEIGFLMGLGKKNVYIVSKSILKKEHKTIKDIPFDLSDQLLIEHSSKEELITKLEKEIPQFIEPIEKTTGYDLAFRKHMQEKLNILGGLQGEKNHVRKLLNFFVLERGELGIARDWIQLYMIGTDIDKDLMQLERSGLIKSSMSQTGIRRNIFYKLEEAYRPFLQEYLWK